MSSKQTKRRKRIPSYRLHRASGQAMVTLDGRDFYLGRRGTEDSRAEYDRLIAEWLANGRSIAARRRELTVNDVILAFLMHAKAYYARPDGKPGEEYGNIRVALGPVRRLYGRAKAAEFGPKALKACRQLFLTGEHLPKTSRKHGRPLTRGVINSHVNRIRRAFRWAVENELVPASVFHGLKAVPGFRKGRSQAKESKKVRPVSTEHVEAVVPLVSPPVAAMIRLQLLTGMRPGEVLQMRPRDIDRGGEIWSYQPEHHKTEHLDHERVIFLGPQAQEVLRPYLLRGQGAYLFSPKEAEQERSRKRREERQSPMTPSQAGRRPKRHPRVTLGDCYTVAAYRRAVARACVQAEIPDWHPHQLRHTAATRLRKEFGLETARVVLGHRSVGVTEWYAERDLERAARAIEQCG